MPRKTSSNLSIMGTRMPVYKQTGHVHQAIYFKSKVSVCVHTISGRLEIMIDSDKIYNLYDYIITDYIIYSFRRDV